MYGMRSYDRLGLFDLYKFLNDMPNEVFTTSPIEPELINIMTGKTPKPVRVIYNKPATIVFWDDGTKTVVKCHHNDTYSKEIGFLMCVMKKIYGNKFLDIMEKFCWR